MPEIYICTSIEIDGPIPGPHSMRSLGSAAFDRNGELLSSFSVNLQRLRGAEPHPDILARWKSMPEAWAVVTHDPEPPGPAVHDYLRWLEGLPTQKVFVGYPAGVPFMFVEWYLHHFTGRSPFRRAALDLRTYAMALLQRPYHGTNKRHMPDDWLRNHPPRTYMALDDAVSVGRLFFSVRGAREDLERIDGPPDDTLPGLLEE